MVDLWQEIIDEIIFPVVGAAFITLFLQIFLYGIIELLKYII